MDYQSTWQNHQHIDPKDPWYNSVTEPWQKKETWSNPVDQPDKISEMITKIDHFLEIIPKLFTAFGNSLDEVKTIVKQNSILDEQIVTQKKTIIELKKEIDKLKYQLKIVNEQKIKPLSTECRLVRKTVPAKPNIKHKEPVKKDYDIWAKEEKGVYIPQKERELYKNLPPAKVFVKKYHQPRSVKNSFAGLDIED
jgi:hypothetical protein